MRQSILLAPLSVALTLQPLLARQVCAQDLGIKFGLSSSDQTSSEPGGPFPNDVEAVLHPTFGLLVSFPLGRWRIAPTLNYIIKGRDNALFYYANSGSVSGSAYGYDQLKYLSVQSDVHLTFPIGAASFYLLVAPRLDLLLDQQTSWSVEPSYSSGTLPAPDVAAYESVVFGGALGIGQDIKVGRHTLVLEARYDRDFTSAWVLEIHPPYSSPFGIGWGPQPIYNRTFLLQLGLRLWTSKPEPVVDREGHWLPVNPRP